MLRYYKVKGNEKATHLKAELYYNLGGWNVFTSRQERRGYYVSVSPVKRDTSGGYETESYVAFTGVKVCVLEVKRKSEKKLREAEAKFESNIENLIKNQFSEFNVDLNDYEER